MERDEVLCAVAADVVEVVTMVPVWFDSDHDIRRVGAELSSIFEVVEDHVHADFVNTLAWEAIGEGPTANDVSVHAVIAEALIDVGCH